MSYKVAVVGATGNVGTEMLSILAERSFPAHEVVAVASQKSVGLTVPYGDQDLDVHALDTFNFSDVDIALFSPGGAISSIYAPIAADAGAIVIDNTSFFRMDPEVPLIVPEVNAYALEHYRSRNIIANPNCAVMQLVVALKPLHELVPIRRVVVTTFQSVSGAGKVAMDTLFEETKGLFANDLPKKETFTKQIAFNLIPHIGVFRDDGQTDEEWKIAVETQKILDPAIAVTATCVRVPVFVGHSMTVNIEFDGPISEEQARDALTEAPGVSVVDYRQDEGYVTPIEAAGEDNVFISRIRTDPTLENGLNMWIVSDNLRKGAALNAVQIAEELVKTYL